MQGKRPILSLKGLAKFSLPTQLTKLVGRDQDISSLLALLQNPEVRLLTLTGPGGVGKTSLALQVANELHHAFTDGIFFVPLAAINDPELVVPAIAKAFALRERKGRPIFEQLKKILYEKRLLLFLDNFEQVIHAASMLTELLQSCSFLKLLVTSREVLHIRGEQEFRVQPLALPDLERLPTNDALLRYTAVDLFTQRVRTVKSDFQITPANAYAVASICIHLDGLPLALELAAARVKVFSPESLVEHLTRNRFQILTQGFRDVDERQQTLRNTIAWSYNLLGPMEQQLFRRLAIFKGGCTLEAVEVVCAFLDNGAMHVLEGVSSLIDKNLLQTLELADGEKSELRLCFLETIREYGMECLRASGEMKVVQEAHARYYLELAESAEQKLTGSQQSLWLEKLEREHDNLRAVMYWSLEQGETEEIEHRVEIAQRLGAALQDFWLVRGYWGEGRSFLEGALSLSVESAIPVKAKAIYATASLALAQSDLDRAEMLGEESMGLFEALGDKSRKALSLHLLGRLARRKGNFTVARALTEEALMLCREIDNKSGVSSLLTISGSIAMEQADYAGARALIEEGVAFWRGAGNKKGTADTLWVLGRVFLYQGDYEKAHALFEESLHLSQEVRDKGSIANAQLMLGFVPFFSGDYVAACSRFENSRTLFKEVGDRRGVAVALYGLGLIALSQGEAGVAESLFKESLETMSEQSYLWFVILDVEGLAAVAGLQGQLEWAAQLWGRAEEMREMIGAPLPPALESRYEQWVKVVRSSLGEDAFGTAKAKGNAMTLEQVLAVQAQSLPHTLPSEKPPALPPKKSTVTSRHSLTRRELDVLRLLAKGWTDTQIADDLIITPRTVNAHLTSIYRKMQVKSRTAAVLYAIKHKLI